MNKLFYSLFILFPTFLAAQEYAERVTGVSNVAITVSNLGNVGNAFMGSYDRLGYPSAEYPRNSGIEHAFMGALWIGGIRNDQIGVSTGYSDVNSGYSAGSANFEFTVEGAGGFDFRSSLRNSSDFSPNAISHEDFISDFTDRNILIPGTQIQINQHDNPLDVSVHFESYNWNFGFANFYVIYDFTIVNTSPDLIDSLYLGYFVNGVVRNTNVTPAAFGGAAYYNKGGNAYIDSMAMSYDFDVNGDIDATNTYFAQKFLGAEDKFGFHYPTLDTAFNGHYNCWLFNEDADPVFFAPSNDNQRYQKMSLGLNQSPCWRDSAGNSSDCGRPIPYWNTIRQPGNRSNLNAVGPFRDFLPGDTIKLAYAFVFAPLLKPEDRRGQPARDTDLERRQLILNAQAAQATYNGEDINFNGQLDEGEDLDGNGRITRYILPEPPEIPSVRVEPGDGKIDIYWTRNAEFSIDPISQEQDFEGYRIYLTELGFDLEDAVNLEESLKLYASYDKPNNGLFFDNGFDSIRLSTPLTFDGDTNFYEYKLTIDNIPNGWQHAVTLTAFDRGNDERNIQSLESAPLANLTRAFPGKKANSDIENKKPFVYPNPYYGGAEWEGGSRFAEDNKIIFANLPARCVIRIMTPAGDVIDQINHDQAYVGADSRWFQAYSDTEEAKFSGGERAWDLLSADNQIISRGMYLFTVEDLDTGEGYTGQFAIIK